MHDDVAQISDAELLETHFAAWIHEMQRILPERHVQVHVRRGIPGVTDAWYGATSALTQWQGALLGNPPADEPMAPDAPGRFNLLLVNERHVLPNAPGATVAQGQRFGFASVNAGGWIAAHELGHMMGADHDVAARREIGFLRTCATIMWAHSNVYEPCGEYSVGNTERIQASRRFWDR